VVVPRRTSIFSILEWQEVRIEHHTNAIMENLPTRDFA